MTISRRETGALALLALGASTAPALAETSDAAAVADAVAALTKAMLAADQLSYGHSSGVVQDRKVFVDVIAGKKTVVRSANARARAVPHAHVLELKSVRKPPHSGA